MNGSSTGSVSVDFENVSKAYGKGPLVLQDMNLTIEPGHLVSVLGPSGCGKTTSLRILAGFEDATAGDVKVGGQSILGTPPNQRNMGMVFQNYSLFPNLSVAENVEYGLRIRKVDRAAQRRKAENLLELIGLPEFGDRFPHQLSGGQQQRVALARALAIEPAVLLLDEPLSALDAAVRATLRDEIRAIQKRLGITTLMVTHDQSEALVMADKVAVMNQGRVEQYAAPPELYNRPATPFLAHFVGKSNEFDVPRSWSESDQLPVQRSGEKTADTIFVRPEALAITPDPDGSLIVGRKDFYGEKVDVTVVNPATKDSWFAAVGESESARFVEGDRVSVALAGDVALRIPAEELEERIQVGD